jgi:ABC-type branched-subunit amino acid transport system ATPase component/ABC-type branched-subunit amino acid transport system permease subunit
VTRIQALLPRTWPDRLRWIFVVLLFIALAAVPTLAGVAEDQFPDAFSAKFTVFLATEALVLALWAVSFNLMLGYTGMVSFGHAAYYGIGAYTVAIGFRTFHLPVLTGLALAPLVTGLFGLATGLVALRAVRLYFSLLTLAISQLLFVVAFQWYDFTNGDNGIHNIQLPDALSDPTAVYYLVGAVTGVCLLLMFVIVRSPFGAALLAVRDNRQRAASVGLNVKAYELAVFTIAGIFAGVAGGLYSIYDLQAFPQLMFWSNNAKPVVITLLGGSGSFLGPVIGALIYTYIENAIGKRFPFQFDIVLGGIVLAVVLLAPGGFVSVPSLIGRLLGRRRQTEVETTGDAIVALEVERVLQSAAVSVESAPVGDVLLQLEGVSKSFGGLRAVDDVDLEIRTGDRHAIIGPNGAGKSTLFNLITGVLRPDSGRIVFDGRSIAGRPSHVIARAGIGRAFQITNIFPRLTVRQNLQYSMLAHHGLTVRPFGIADRNFRDEALDLLTSVGLGSHAELPAGQLSHGDQRALELAISIALGSRLLLLDEPTAGMSPYETVKAMELVRRLAAERGLTLLFCEHDMEVVFGTARTVTVMNYGSVLVQGSPDEIRRNPDVQKLYLGELEVEASA